MSLRAKFGIVLLFLLLGLAALSWFYGAEHWMARMAGFATVTVDDRRVRADTYIAHPTFYESDAILLVIVPGEGNYLLNFGEEKFREIPSDEFIRLHWGVVTVSPVSKGA